MVNCKRAEAANCEQANINIPRGKQGVCDGEEEGAGIREQNGCVQQLERGKASLTAVLTNMNHSTSIWNQQSALETIIQL